MRRAAPLLALLLALAPAPTRAQQSDTLLLTLEQALEIARRNNPTYLRAANALELNGHETRSALTSGIFPSLSLSLLNTGYTGNLQRRATDNFGNPIANPDADYVYFSSTQQGLSLNWQLQGLTPWYRWKRTGAENDLRTLNEAAAREALRVDVARRFFDALEQQELAAAEQAIADATRSDLEAAERLFELALGSRVDVLQAELQIEQRRLAVRTQEGARDQARLTLGTLLGEADLRPVRPAPTEVPLYDPYALDEEGLIARARDGSALVRQGQARLSAAESMLDEGRASYLPRLSAGFDVGRRAQGPRTGSLFDLGGFGDDLYSTFGVSLSLPFFSNPFGNQAQVARVRVARDDAEDDLRQARLESERLVRSALLTLRNRWDELGIAERSLAIAAEALELSRESYRLGTRTFEQLQQSVVSEANARRQLIGARYGFVDASLDLEAAVGAPLR